MCDSLMTGSCPSRSQVTAFFQTLWESSWNEELWCKGQADKDVWALGFLLPAYKEMDLDLQALWVSQVCGRSSTFSCCDLAFPHKTQHFWTQEERVPIDFCSEIFSMKEPFWLPLHVLFDLHTVRTAGGVWSLQMCAMFINNVPILAPGS